MLSFPQAVALVREKLSSINIQPRIEVRPLHECLQRFLAEDIAADRDYPPFHRSTRDGFAVRSEDVAKCPVTLTLKGETRAGAHFAGSVGKGECVSIMTGAPLPDGADSVVMVEYTRTEGSQVQIERSVAPAENIVRKGSEATSGSVVLPRGVRLGPSELGLLATVGKSRASVSARPNVAILPTGDELVPIDETPEWFQIRNSNSSSLAAQVTLAGGLPTKLPVAADRPESLRELIEQGMKSDLLLLTGGVSVGKYDFVEQVLADLGAEFYFQSVAIRPGKPVVFGKIKNTFFFGLPGNPISTFVTFALFGIPTIRVLAGGEFYGPLLVRARLGHSIEQRANLRAFLPARVESDLSVPTVRTVAWQGSGDLVGVAAANCFLVIHPDQTSLSEGEWVDVMLK